MKLVALAACVGMLVVVSGCTEQSSPGGPGVKRQAVQPQPEAKSTTTTANKPVEQNVVINKNETFRLVLPNSESFDRGKTTDMTVSINRGRDFNESVKLQFSAPKGVTITPAEPVIPAGHDKIKVSVAVANDAPREKTSMNVKAIPQTGQMVEMPMQIELK
jgi:hypothetical protein